MVSLYGSIYGSLYVSLYGSLYYLINDICAFSTAKYESFIPYVIILQFYTH